MDKIKKYLILIVILIIVDAIVKSIGFNSDMVFIIGILIIGLFIFIDYKFKVKIIDNKSIGKLKVIKTNKINIDVCDVIVFNEYNEIIETINSLYNSKDKVNITISDFDNNKYVIDSKVASDNINNKSYIVKFSDNTDFKYVNMFLHSKLKTTTIINKEMLKYEVLDNLNINSVCIKVNGNCVKNFKDVSIYKYGKFVGTLSRSGYSAFKNYYNKKYNYYFKNTYDEFIDELKKDDRVVDMVYELYYDDSSRDMMESAIIMDESQKNFYACDYCNYDYEFSTVGSIKKVLLITSFREGYKDLLNNEIIIEVK